MKPHSDLTLRRIAALRELADLGRTINDACILLDVDYGSIYHLRKKFNIELKDARMGRPGRIRTKILRDHGKPGMTNVAMAERYGTTRQSIGVIVNNLRKEGKLPPSSHPRVKPAKLASELEANP